MAAERMRSEVNNGDLPKIGLGNFNWQPVDKQLALSSLPATPATNAAQTPIAAKRMLEIPKPAPALTSECYPLNLLENKTFAGTGYNVIWRPRSSKPIQPVVAGTEPDVLELNLTGETMAFSGSIGDVPNRGVGGQADISLKGLSYVQRIGAFENSKTGSNDAEPVAIHFEPGVFMFVPASSNPQQPATLNRMASIPHGTTINAQGLVPSAPQAKGPPTIPKTSIIPFTPGKPLEQKGSFFPQLDFDQTRDNRLPILLSKFSKQAITKEIFNDPNQVLRNAITGQEIESFVTFELTTQPGKNFFGGGTANIGFLRGTEEAIKTASGNADAVAMTVTYWIETVGKTLTIEPNYAKEQVFEMVSPAGVLGPKFVVPPTTSLTSRITKRVTWTQIQYSQNVTLNFNTLSWPHISVATLGDTSTIKLPLTA